MAGLRSLLVVMMLALAAAVAAADLETITHGQNVDLTQHLVPGKMVLFDFYADWCGPCRALEPQVKRLAEQHAANLAVRKVDIVNWQSAVSRQYRISSVPHLKLFGEDGALLAQGNAPEVLSVLERRLRGDTDAGIPAGRSRPPRWPLVALLALLAVVAWVATRRGRPPTPSPSAPAASAAGTVGDGVGVGPPATAGPAVWFAMIQGSLEGPFDVAQLEDLCRQGVITHSTGVRRRGDAAWTTLDEILG